MAIPKGPPQAFLFAAVFSRHDEALDWVRDRISSQWGKVALSSSRFEHTETSYYESEMGTSLRKQFLVVEDFFDPEALPRVKVQSNAWELEMAAQANYAEPRPVNIDPGYLTLSKLVLASAKDRAHRLYMADGIYAEECLYYLDHGWQSRPWTYPDYQRADFQSFFLEARKLLKKKIALKR